tara:strand:- start:271 stop:1965 length:1695 start_codon:yes stop_codon:yes gene_type:complete
MGVPGLFLWLLKKYDLQNLLVQKGNIKQVEYLFIDTNCLLHPQCFKVLGEVNDKININRLESKMITNCLEYLEYIIRYVDPSKLVYISIDGVAPYAKVKQQRLRRFKSAKDAILFNNLKKKYKKPIYSNWTNSSITPGTVFMDKLHKALKNFINEKLNEYNIIYSSCYIEQEGEHKILQYIRNNIKDDSINCVIYGLDADLIFLSLSTFKDNIYLLRESTEFNKNEDSKNLDFVSIDTIKEYIYDEFIYSIVSKTKLDRNSIIQDFIFLCFFLGNDFLPHLPTISLYTPDKKKMNNGLDLLLYCYSESFKIYNDYIIKIIDDKIIFNKDMIVNILDNLILFEKEYLINEYKHKKYFRRYNGNDPYERELYKINNLQFKIINNINLGKDDEKLWKYRYYNKYYNTDDNLENTLHDACNEYFKGLVWNSYYYFKKCISWTWFYKFNHGPFLSDLRTYIKFFDFNNTKFIMNKPLKPLEQLLCVLPPQYAFLLPKSYKFLTLNTNSPIIHLYPRDFELDMLYKNKYWQCIPNIPNFENNIIEISSKFKLSKDELNRNRKEKLFMNYK